MLKYTVYDSIFTITSLSDVSFRVQYTMPNFPL